MNVRYTEATNGEFALSIQEARTGVAVATMAVASVEEQVVGFLLVEEDVARIKALFHHRDVARMEVEEMGTDVSNQDEAVVQEDAAAIIHVENRTITMDRSERNSLEIAMVGRNLITTTTDLSEVTGNPEAALIHVSLPTRTVLDTLANGNAQPSV